MAPDDSGARLPEDLEIEGERPVLHVAKVEPHGILSAQVGSSVDLPESCQAGLDDQPAANVIAVLRDLRGQWRPGPHQGHLAEQDIEELRKLIQRPAPQPPPVAVIRGSLRILNNSPSPSSSAAIASLRCSASGTIVRNLTTVKGSPSFPILVCAKKTGQPSWSMTAAVMNTKSGLRRQSAAVAMARSKKIFIVRLAPLRSAWSTCSKGSPATGLMVVRGPATSMTPAPHTDRCAPSPAPRPACAA